MEVIDISSTDSEDDTWEDETEDFREDVDKLSPSIEDQSKGSTPTVKSFLNPDSGSNFDIHDIGHATWEDDANPLTEYTRKPSPHKGCSPSKEVSSTNGRINNNSILSSFGLQMHSGGNSEEKFDAAAKDMGNGKIEPLTGPRYGRPIPPFKPTMHSDNGSEQNAVHNGVYMWKGDVKPSKEHIQRTLPPSILPMVHVKDGFRPTINQSNNNTWQVKGKSSEDYIIMASQRTLFPGGDSDAQYGKNSTDISERDAKPSTDNKQKRILPPSVQPTVSKTLPKASIKRGDDDVQILGFHGSVGSFGGAKVTNPKLNSKDNTDRKNDRIQAYENAGPSRQLCSSMSGRSATGNIDRKNDRIQTYENAGPCRQLPPWMSGGSATGRYAPSSVTSSLSVYSDGKGNHSGTAEIEPDERLIFQAALQDLAQPKYEVDLPAGLLTVPLLRHQRIALAWMRRKETSAHCSGGILADDQGLGKTVSIIALIQMDMPHQVDFSSSLSRDIKSDVLNLDENDHVPEDKKTEHSEEDLGARPHNSDQPSNHSGHTACKDLNLVEIDEEWRELDMDFGEDVKTKAFNSESSDLVKLDLPICKMQQADHSGESSSSKVPSKKSKKSTMSKGKPTGGTLVVCPATILRQWAQELDEKVPEGKKLKVLIYHGSARSKDPSFLAKYDVVLTTYTIVTNEVPKQPLSVEKNSEDYALSSEFSLQSKRKKTSDVHKRVKKKKKGACDASFDFDSGPLARVRWFRVVLDEAQTIKNFRTLVSRACCGLRAKRRWCLSGTPLQNSLDDLFSYFRFLKYDPYCAFSSFCSSLKNPITRNATVGYQKLQLVLRTIMLRRTKGTLIDGEPIIKLPPKLIHLKKIYFSPEEKDFYSNLEADSRQKFKAFAAAGTVNQNYASILVLLLRLRQACDHPLLVKEYHSGPVAKASLKVAKQLPRDMLTDLLNRLEASLAICGICNDPPEDAVVTMCGHVFCYQCVSGYLTGDDNLCPAADCKDILGADSVFSGATLRNRMSGEPVEDSLGVAKSLDQSFSSSSKIEAVIDILKSICKTRCPEGTEEQCDERLPSPHGNNASFSEAHTDSNAKASEYIPSNIPQELPVKAIVFSQWTSMLDLLEISLNQSLLQYRRLDGTMSLSLRDRAVKDFNTDPEVSVMIMSLKAGNLGLNMIAACFVILLDPWWNPTTEDQAIDRAHRIGQVRPVNVFRLTVSDTVEDRILALQEKKREMVSSAFGEDQTVGQSTRLNVDDLRFLFEA